MHNATLNPNNSSMIYREKDCAALTPVSGAKITPKKKSKRKDKLKERCGNKTPPTCLSENPPDIVSSSGNDIVREKIVVSTPEKKSPKSRKNKRLKKAKAVVLDVEV